MCRFVWKNVQYSRCGASTEPIWWSRMQANVRYLHFSHIYVKINNNTRKLGTFRKIVSKSSSSFASACAQFIHSLAKMIAFLSSAETT